MISLYSTFIPLYKEEELCAIEYEFYIYLAFKWQESYQIKKNLFSKVPNSHFILSIL